MKNLDFEPLVENNTIFFYDTHGTIFSYGSKKKILIGSIIFIKKDLEEAQRI